MFVVVAPPSPPYLESPLGYMPRGLFIAIQGVKKLLIMEELFTKNLKLWHLLI